MFKKLVKNSLAGYLYHAGYKSSRHKQRNANKCIILMYHRILPDDKAEIDNNPWLTFSSLPGIIVKQDMFRRQIEFLRENYTVIPLKNLAESIKSGKPLPPDSLVITFDDGWRDNYLCAFSILKEYAIPATIFLTAGYIGTDRLFWPETLMYCLKNYRKQCELNFRKCEDTFPFEIKSALEDYFTGSDTSFNRIIESVKSLAPDERGRAIDLVLGDSKNIPNESGDRRVMMSWEEAREMHSAGIDFGSHGIEHEILTQLSPENQIRELTESKTRICGELKIDNLSFAYPNGNYDESLKKNVSEAGYYCAVGTKTGKVSGKSDLFALERINVHNDNGAGLSGKFSRTLFAYHIDMRIFGWM